MKGRIAALFGVALLGALAGCAPHRTILDPPVGVSAGLPQAGPVQLGALKDEAESWVGTPYRLGGNGRGGVDCSGYVHKVYTVLGLKLPRTVETLYEVGESIHRRKLRVGDLVFFRMKGRGGPTHVGIYLGANLFIHASIHGGVRTDTLEGGVYDERLYGCRRVLA